MFMAPECLRPIDESKAYEGHDGRAADVWALGICAYVRTATYNQTDLIKAPGRLSWLLDDSE